MNDEAQLTIGAFARRSRLSVKALRLYEEHGLLSPAEVDDDTGYRRYREEQLRDARIIRMLRRIDMPMAEAALIMRAPRQQRAALLEQYWARVEQRFEHQRLVAGHLRTTLSEGKERYPMVTIETRDVAEQTVLTEQRHTTAAGLSAWIAEAGERQMTALQAVGGPIDSSFVIYHGEVTEDSDGPVEVCSPVDPSAVGAVGVPSRVIPAHREAFARITRAQVQFPDILSVYDAVENWIAANGERVAGPPREVYFVDFMTAAPDDDAADVAFPIA